MSWLAKLRRRARLLLDRNAVEREMADEMRFHLEMEADELARFGANPEEAATIARRRFGGVARFQDDAREARGGWWLEELRQDARYALRVLGRGRAFVVIAVLTLAGTLATGTNSVLRLAEHQARTTACLAALGTLQTNLFEDEALDKTKSALETIRLQYDEYFP